MDTSIRKEYESRGDDYDKLLLWHHTNGFVVDLPDSFVMGFVYDEKGEKVLYVSYMRGDMELLMEISSLYDLTFIEFKRNFAGKVKRYDIDKLKRRVRNNDTGEEYI